MLSLSFYLTPDRLRSATAQASNIRPLRINWRAIDLLNLSQCRDRTRSGNEKADCLCLLTGNDGNCFSADTKADHERGLNAGLLGEIQNGDYQRRQRNCRSAVGIPHFNALRHDKYQEQGPTDEVLSRHLF